MRAANSLGEYLSVFQDFLSTQQAWQGRRRTVAYVETPPERAPLMLEWSGLPKQYGASEGDPCELIADHRSLPHSKDESRTPPMVVISPPTSSQAGPSSNQSPP